MKAKKAIKRLSKVESILSNVIDQFSSTTKNGCVSYSTPPRLRLSARRRPSGCKSRPKRLRNRRPRRTSLNARDCQRKAGKISP